MSSLHEPGRTVPLVVIVDDEPAMLRSWKRLLGELPCEARTYLDALAALAELAELQPAVIISDLWRADLDGEEFLRRAHALVPRAVLVLHTGVPRQVSRGFRGIVLVKPVPAEALRAFLLARLSAQPGLD